MKFLNWNARGINSSKKRQVLADLIVHHHIDFIAIQETKKETFTARSLKSISNKFDLWFWVPSKGRSGGILFGGDSSQFKYISHSVHTFYLDLRLECKLDGQQWQITIVYGPVDRTKKKAFWDELELLRNTLTLPWILCGDFNAIRHRTDKSGPLFDIPTSTLFNNFVNRHQLIEHKLSNRKYTWSNGNRFALLDRFFTNIPWDQMYPTSFCSDLGKYGSDHCPLVLNISANFDHSSSIFRFDPLWLEQPEFIQLVHKWWGQYPLDPTDIDKSWNAKLKFLRRKIKGWARNFYSSKKKMKQHLLDRLHSLELILEQRNFSPLEHSEWIHTKQQLDDIYLEEEIHWKARSKQKWLEEGDNNTKYFHTIATHRSKKNKILSLDINGQQTSTKPEIHNHILSFYKNLLGVSGNTNAYLDPDFWEPNDILTPIEQLSLETPFTIEEVKKAVFACEPHRAPGPDGFSFKFYQFFWDLIHSDFMTLCMQFYNHQTNLTSLNRSIICLIPKEKDATLITKFRPISLVNCSFKIISKILTFRLETLMSRLIDSSQAAFIKHRNILDNVILSQEILHHCHSTNESGVVIKVDFEKAYDKINWAYLLDILESRGFGTKWLKWIKEWLISSQSCININGELTSYFFFVNGGYDKGIHYPLICTSLRLIPSAKFLSKANNILNCKV